MIIIIHIIIFLGWTRNRCWSSCSSSFPPSPQSSSSFHHFSHKPTVSLLHASCAVFWWTPMNVVIFGCPWRSDWRCPIWRLHRNWAGGGCWQGLVFTAWQWLAGRLRRYGWCRIIRHTASSCRHAWIRHSIRWRSHRITRRPLCFPSRSPSGPHTKASLIDLASISASPIVRVVFLPTTPNLLQTNWSDCLSCSHRHSSIRSYWAALSRSWCSSIWGPQ